MGKFGGRRSIELTTDVIAQKASEVAKTIGCDFEPVRKLVEENDVVIAIWPEPGAKEGFGKHLVKGRRAVMDIVATERPKEMNWTAIPCICLEQAIALQQVCGEPELSWPSA